MHKKETISELDNTSPELAGKTTQEAVTNSKGTTIIAARKAITKEIATKLASLKHRKIK